MYAVLARYQVQPGRGDEVAHALRPHLLATRNEPGCLVFTANRSVDDPDSFVLYEQYKDEESFKAHVDSAHYETYVVSRVRPLLAHREVAFFTAIEP
jgi:Uncharacterized conserved protein